MRMVWVMMLMISSVNLADAGEFKGSLELVPEGCERQLECTVKNEFGYVDSEGTGWQAMAGVKTDGASIPIWAQPFVGGQFDRQFIRASVIHDHYCKRHVRDWRKTHWVFYDALLADNVSKEKALLMYYAVYLAGPKWIELIKGKPCPTGLSCIQKIPDNTWPTNTSQVRSEEDGGTYLVRKHQYDAPRFSTELKEVEKLIGERGGAITREELEKRAQELRPNDFFYANPAAVAIPVAPEVNR